MLIVYKMILGLQFIIIGLFATLVMDLGIHWGSKLLGTTATSCDLTGRWVGMLLLRRKQNGKITEMPKLRYERVFGLFGHYLMGAVMVATFLWLMGDEWRSTPTLLPLIGFLSLLILFPLCVLQPFFGFGFFGSKTRNPLAACQRVFFGYVWFGLGIYLGIHIIHF